MGWGNIFLGGAKKYLIENSDLAESVVKKLRQILVSTI
jgi:hypothetical protein